MLAGAFVLAGGIIYGILQAEKKITLIRQQGEVAKLDNIEKILLKYEHDASQNREKIFRKVDNMNETLLNNEQKMRRFILLGDINSSYQVNPPPKTDLDQNAFMAMAIKYYRRAMEFAQTKDERNAILRKIGELYVQSKNWSKALELYKEADSSSFPLTPEDRWRFKINQAECYKKLKDYHEAFMLYSQVADECDNPELWGKAALEKANFQLKAAKDPEILKLFMKDPEANAAEYKSKFEDEALKSYTEIIKEVPSTSPEAARAQLGVLDIYVMKGNKKASYDLTNKIQASPASMVDKASALILLSKLEEDKGNNIKAVEILETCIKRYPKTNKSVEISKTLYGLYKKTENWDKAFSVAEQLFVNLPDEETIKTLLDDFSPGQNHMLEVISHSDQRDKYIDKTRSMLNALKENHPGIWKNIQNEAYFVFAELLFLSEKYEAAEKELEICVNLPKGDRGMNEKAYYLDLLCAIKAKRPPLIIAIRSKRYLDKYPDGKYFKEVLSYLLDSYYDAGFYESALAVSKKIYVDELNSAKKGSKVNEELWLRNVVKIGQTYEKLGYYDRANKIIKMYSDRILKEPYAAEIYMSWSEAALRNGQEKEALRRIEVAIPYALNMDQKYKMYVAQYLLILKAGAAKDFYKMKNLLERLDASPAVSANVKNELEQVLYEELLGYAYKNDMQGDYEELLSKAVKKFPTETWTLYWMLKSVSSLFGKSELEALRKRHQELLENAKVMAEQDADAYSFIKEQMKLISTIEKIEQDAQKLKTERGIVNE